MIASGGATAYSLDQSSAAFIQAFTGKSRDTLLEQGVEYASDKMGLSEGTKEVIGAIADPKDYAKGKIAEAAGAPEQVVDALSGKKKSDKKMMVITFPSKVLQFALNLRIRKKGIVQKN